jgi:uncharacterized membrane protein YkgB
MSVPAERKIQVVANANAGDALGRMDPRVGLVTQYGTITAVGTEFVTVSGQGVGTPSVFYPGELFVTEAEATDGYSWPSGDGSIVFGHRAPFASGVPLAANSTGGVVTYPNGSLVNFTR